MGCLYAITRDQNDYFEENVVGTLTQLVICQGAKALLRTYSPRTDQEYI